MSSAANNPSRSLAFRGYSSVIKPGPAILLLLSIIALLYIFMFATEFKILFASLDMNMFKSDSKILSDTAATVHAAWTTAKAHEIPVDFKVHSSCIDKDIIQTQKYNTTISEMAKNFHVDQDSYYITKGRSGEDGIIIGSMTLHFQILECPFRHEASTFHVQMRTDDSVFSGSVGNRYKVEEDCGYYNATVPIVPFLPRGRDMVVKERKCGNNATIASTFFATIEAFWTSEYLNYHKHINDMKVFQQMFKIKDTLTPENITDMLGEDRLRQLEHHLDILTNFPVVIEFPKDVLDTFFQPRLALPNCTDVPLKDWLPAGVHQSTDDPDQWHFQSHKCNYRTFDRKDLQYLFAGMRVKYLGDSHGQFESKYVQSLTCPEANNSDVFHQDKYACSMQSPDTSQPLNSFSFGWRFYRGIEWLMSLHGKQGDMDGGFTTSMRHAKKTACSKFFGVGFQNATIITTPSWLFPYDSSEGVFDYLVSLRSSIEYCRRLYPKEMDDIVLLVQTPTAGNIIPATMAAVDQGGWRENRHFLMQAFCQAMEKELDGIVDGIIPVSEFTLARNWILSTQGDGVHLRGSYYNEIFHIQAMAVLSAMRSKGWQIPMIPENDKRARWFASVPFE